MLKVLLNFFQKIVRVWGETPRSFGLKEDFERVWEWFCDRKALPILSIFY